MTALKDVFRAVAYKELASVDLPFRGSNQHELNGSNALRELFDAPVSVIGSNYRVEGTIHWRYFADDQEVITDEQSFTFYDARARTADRTGRSEWRLYYYGDFLSRAEQGDAVVLVRTHDAKIIALVFQKDSAWLRAARSLFEIDPVNRRLQSIPDAVLNNQSLDFVQIQILEELGIEIAVPVTPTDEDIIVARFGSHFPTTAEMSAFARTQIEVDVSLCDETLIRWLNREEELFRALEAVQVRQQLDAGFRDVEHFLSYSLSVQNRRKSRMGQALQHHLAALFHAHHLRFDKEKTTEGKNKPDFLFPGQSEYLNIAFSERELVMLAAKSTCKERWRQILTEANRIKIKHLCTLEASISTEQTNEMKLQKVQLVIPASIHHTYSSTQQKEMLAIEEFVQYIYTGFKLKGISNMIKRINLEYI